MTDDDFKYSKAPCYTKYVPGEVFEEFVRPTDSQYTGGASIHRSPYLSDYAQLIFNLRGATVQNRFRFFTKHWKDRNAMGFRESLPDGKFGEYRFITFEKLAELSTAFGSGLLELGIKRGDRIGVFSKNCMEWGITDYACALFNIINTPVYDAYRPEDCKFIMEHSGMRALIVAPSLLQFIVKLKTEGNLPEMEFIIVIDNPTNPEKPVGATHLFSEVVKLGSEHVHPDAENVNPETLYTIVYTSGTTGTPKGAMISHRAFCSGCVMLLVRLPKKFDFNKGGRFFSYLPLAHIFERTLEALFLDAGVTIGYFTGSVANLTSDISTLKTTILPGVPRVFNKTYDKITNTLQNSFFAKRWMFSLAFNNKKKMTADERVEKQNWADTLVFSNIRKTFGGCLDVLYCGSAPLSGKVAEFLSICLGAPLAEGYGSTETCCCVTCTHVVALDLGNVGIPHPYTEVRLESIPEMDYSTDDKPNPRGEVLLRGPQLFMGYYKDEEQSKAVFTEDGFLRTGDVGEWVDGPYGKGLSLRVIDRRKNIFKLSQGEFICAERVESLYLQSEKFLSSMMLASAAPSLITIVGSGSGSKALPPAVAVAPPPKDGANVNVLSQSILMSYTVPNWVELLSKENSPVTHSDSWPGVVEYQNSLEKETTHPTNTQDECPVPLELRKKLAGYKPVRDFYLKLLANKQKTSEGVIKSYEIVQGVVISPIEWGPQNGLTTPSFKVKRELVKQQFLRETEEEVQRVIAEGEKKTAEKEKNRPS